MARSHPVPSNSSDGCSRWKTPNSDLAGCGLGTDCAQGSLGMCRRPSRERHREIRMDYCLVVVDDVLVFGAPVVAVVNLVVVGTVVVVASP